LGTRHRGVGGSPGHPSLDLWGPSGTSKRAARRGERKASASHSGHFTGFASEGKGKQGLAVFEPTPRAKELKKKNRGEGRKKRLRTLRGGKESGKHRPEKKEKNGETLFWEKARCGGKGTEASRGACCGGEKDTSHPCKSPVHTKGGLPQRSDQ